MQAAIDERHGSVRGRDSGRSPWKDRMRVLLALERCSGRSDSWCAGSLGGSDKRKYNLQRGLDEAGGQNGDVGFGVDFAENCQKGIVANSITALLDHFRKGAVVFDELRGGIGVA